MGLGRGRVQGTVPDLGDGRDRCHMTAMTDETTTAPAAPGNATPLPGPTPAAEPAAKGPEQKPGEIGGPKGPEPTRYGDWEFKGRCTDF